MFSLRYRLGKPMSAKREEGLLASRRARCLLFWPFFVGGGKHPFLKLFVQICCGGLGVQNPQPMNSSSVANSV